MARWTLAALLELISLALRVQAAIQGSEVAHNQRCLSVAGAFCEGEKANTNCSEGSFFSHTHTAIWVCWLGNLGGKQAETSPIGVLPCGLPISMSFEHFILCHSHIGVCPNGPNIAGFPLNQTRGMRNTRRSLKLSLDPPKDRTESATKKSRISAMSISGDPVAPLRRPRHT